MAPSGQMTASALEAMLKDATLAGSWTLDASRSTIGLRSKSMWGLAPVKGVFRQVSGTGAVSPAGEVSGTITVAAASVDTKNKRRDKHLRSADFFDTENHRYATFRSTRVEDHGDGEFTLQGDLTIRDVTRPVSLNGEYLGSQVSPWGDTRVGFSAETEVSRKDWGLEWNLALETGGVVVGDKIKLVIDAEWIRQ